LPKKAISQKKPHGAKTEGQNRYILDEALIQKDMEFDGYYAVYAV